MLKLILKFGFAGALIYWLLKSDKLDFSLVQRSLSDPATWTICLGLIIFQGLIAALRWKKLLEVESNKKLPYFQLVKLNWIGLFFNSFLPGAVTGDLIKLVYAKDLDRDLSKTSLVTTAFLDRIFGLSGLLCLMGFFSLINYQEMTSLSPKLKTLIHFNLLLFSGALLFISTLFFPKKGQAIVLSLSESIPIIGSKLKKTFEKVWLIGSCKQTVFQALLYSLIIQFLSVFVFWLISSPFYGKEIPLSLLFTFIPAGLIAVAIPIAPAGLGVGHLAFDSLFRYAGIAGGASFFNLFFLCNISVNLMGLIPYLLTSKPKKLSLDEDELMEGLASK